MSGRIHIVGGPGSGKTTLARRLGHVLTAPVYDLDTIAYESGAGRKRDRALRRLDAERIAATSDWIAEGIYLSWCGPLAERAEKIVWLDIPWRVAVDRIVRRHVRLSAAGTNRHPGLPRLARFIWSTRHYYLAHPEVEPAHPEAEPVIADANDDGAITRAATQAWLRHYGDKVVRCRTNTDLHTLVTTTAARHR